MSEAVQSKTKEVVGTVVIRDTNWRKIKLGPYLNFISQIYVYMHVYLISITQSND